jgi:hypothetical protein
VRKCRRRKHDACSPLHNSILVLIKSSESPPFTSFFAAQVTGRSKRIAVVRALALYPRPSTSVSGRDFNR